MCVVVVQELSAYFIVKWHYFTYSYVPHDASDSFKHSLTDVEGLVVQHGGLHHQSYQFVQDQWQELCQLLWFWVLQIQYAANIYISTLFIKQYNGAHLNETSVIQNHG